MSDAPQARFAGYYAAPRAPWDIGRPQRAFIEAGEAIVGRASDSPARVLDSGCGTGDLALWLAEQGCRVTGVDFLEKPLEAARRKAQDRGLAANFLQMDALAVGEIPERFDAVTDCGLFHVFDDAGRAAYVAALERVFPGRQVKAALLYTEGPRLVTLPDALMRLHRPQDELLLNPGDAAPIFPE